MFSFDAFVKLNLFLRGVYRLAYLNLLWIAATLAGLVLFGIGPASYAVAAYVDRWFRFGETPPVTRAFITHFRAQYWRAAAMGWILTAAALIVSTNILGAGTWMLRFANIVALVVICIITAYVFPVMVATDIRGPLRQIAAALMLGIGSLQWTIIAGAAVAGAMWLLATYALPALMLFGIGIPAAAIGFVTRVVFGALTEDDPQTSPPRARESAHARVHLARGTSE
ncbi:MULTISPECIES: YesL family protein [unclassified Microbacterium]|uniref:YesL family protein n=1 Tax=unclassified Microbacterium TaxID=2609290 RepID=UPI0012F79B77|nr:DUF624 domain-containing protein [Microbacterium sp. MAH-37]MVQ43474.1 DUF624 domain-containing protein [Microbacterium sp. MAH-37]